MPDHKQSVIMGGLVGALVATILTFPAQGGNPVVGFAACCIPAILGGLIAAAHYASTNSLTLALGTGAKLGALAGVVAALVSGALGFLLRMLGVLPSVSEMQVQQREKLIEQGLTDQQIEQAMRWGEMMSGTVGQIVAVVIACIVFALIGALGGLIGASMFKRGSTTEPV